MSKEVKIASRLVGSNNAPFCIAEMSGNHNQSLERALQIVDAAANAGAHAIKIQTYTADTMTMDIDDERFQILNPQSLWHGKSLYSLYKDACTPWEWHKPIFDRASELGMLAFSSPFDESSVDFLESLNVPCYKIASFENTDHRLIRKAASTGRPLIISTGMATVAELDETVRVARAAGCRDLILLKCTSTYPASPENSNLRTIPHLRELFECQVGLSDHTMGTGVAVAAVALGASVVEKHLTLRRDEGGVDSAFSLEPEEFRTLVEETGRAWQALGQVSYGATRAEESSLMFRRSLFISADVKKGDVLSEKNVRCIRPGHGMAVKNWDLVIGKVAQRDIKKGTPLTWDLI